MDLVIHPGTVSGDVRVPGSKSHTIRGLLLGMLAGGTSRLLNPLDSADTRSCLATCRALGADVDAGDPDEWHITGTGGQPRAADRPVDVGNSGTTLYLAMTAAALAGGKTEFTGDAQIRRRSAAALLDALRSLGADACSINRNGCAPLVVGGGLHGGHVSIECPTSQYLSSLLIGCPLADGESTIEVPLLNEAPYVGMTLGWLDFLAVQYDCAEDYSRFRVPGNQSYAAFGRAVPGDFSSATFFLVAAAVAGSRLFLRGLDMADTQGDKAVVAMLEQMGCRVEAQAAGLALAGPPELQGGTFDLNATPDALPAMAVAGCRAQGETRLLNVPQARIKETDRIAVMAAELARMGADVKELPDGLVVRNSRLQGAAVDGHDDHRVVMALAVAGLVAEGETLVRGAEAASVTFPQFIELMQSVGAQVDVRE